MAAWTRRDAGLALLSAMLVACAVAARDPYLGSPNAVQPDYKIYHHKNELLQAVKDVVASNTGTMQLETMHAKDGGYDVDMMVVTVEPGGLSNDHSQKVRLLLDFGEHGREFISCEVGLALLRTLANSTAVAQMAGSPARAQRLLSILQRVVLKVLPMENPKGRELVEGGRLCERKNGRGVDTNRNWDIDWGKKEHDYDPNEEFPGRAPHSEPEVQMILTLAKALKPHVWLNVHSGMFALFTPYDHKASTPRGVSAVASLRLLQRINDDVCAGRCAVGSGGRSVGYLAHGTATDYMYEVLRVPLSFTWEIFGDFQATFEDCFRMFNPVDQIGFDATVKAWVGAILQLLELLPTHPATLPLLRGTQLLPELDGHVVAAAGQRGGSGGGQQLEPERGVGLGDQAVTDARSISAVGDAGGAKQAQAQEVQALQAEAARLAAGLPGEVAAGEELPVWARQGTGGGAGRRSRWLPLLAGVGGMAALCAVLVRQQYAQTAAGYAGLGNRPGRRG